MSRLATRARLEAARALGAETAPLEFLEEFSPAEVRRCGKRRYELMFSRT